MSPISRHKTIADFEQAYPWIPWRTPIRVSSTTDTTRPFFGCRVCIGMRGLHGNEIELLPRTRREWELHFRANHGKPGEE